MLIRLKLLIVVMLSSAAFAQPAPSLDVASWFVDIASLAAVIVAVIALIRKHLLPALDGVAVPIASLALGALLGLLGHALGYVPGDLSAGAIFGLTAGLLASGGVDGLRAIVKASAPAVTIDADTTTVNASPRGPDSTLPPPRGN